VCTTARESACARHERPRCARTRISWAFAGQAGVLRQPGARPGSDAPGGPGALLGAAAHAAARTPRRCLCSGTWTTSAAAARRSACWATSGAWPARLGAWRCCARTATRPRCRSATARCPCPAGVGAGRPRAMGLAGPTLFWRCCRPFPSAVRCDVSGVIARSRGNPPACPSAFQ